MPEQVCTVGFVAATGRAVAAAVMPGPQLVGKWGLLLAPPGQDRFVFHAAQELDGGAEAWVAASTAAIGRQTQDAVDAVLAELSHPVRRAAIVGTTLDLELSVAQIIASHTRVHTAEGALYRSAIVDALEAREIATTLVSPDELEDRSALDHFGKVPTPWRREHKDAALAAVLVSRGRASGRAGGTRTGRAAPRRRPG